MTQNYYTRQEILNLTGISERNLKFWTHEYSIPTKKSGRRTLYSRLGLQILKTVLYLSSSNLVTMKFVNRVVEQLKSRDQGLPATDAELQELFNLIQMTPGAGKETMPPPMVVPTRISDLPKAVNKPVKPRLAPQKETPAVTVAVDPEPPPADINVIL